MRKARSIKEPPIGPQDQWRAGSLPRVRPAHSAAVSRASGVRHQCRRRRHVGVRTRATGRRSFFRISCLSRRETQAMAMDNPSTIAAPSHRLAASPGSSHAQSSGPSPTMRSSQGALITAIATRHLRARRSPFTASGEDTITHGNVPRPGAYSRRHNATLRAAVREHCAEPL